MIIIIISPGTESDLVSLLTTRLLVFNLDISYTSHIKLYYYILISYSYIAR